MGWPLTEYIYLCYLPCSHHGHQQALIISTIPFLQLSNLSHPHSFNVSSCNTLLSQGLCTSTSLPGGPFPKESYSSPFFTSLKSCLKYPVCSETFPRHPIWNRIFSPTLCASFLLDFARNHLPSNIYISYLFDFSPWLLQQWNVNFLGTEILGCFVYGYIPSA